jgi:chemotaxis signal transduction protein
MVSRFLVVDLGSVHFGFDLEMATEVLTLPRCARVPWGPSWVRGVFNHQGRLYTVADLARFLEVIDPAEPEKVVLVDRSDLNLALAVRGVAVVEARHAVRITEVKHFMPHAAWITESLSTPTLDFQHLDLRRVTDGIEEAF